MNLKPGKIKIRNNKIINHFRTFVFGNIICETYFVECKNRYYKNGYILCEFIKHDIVLKEFKIDLYKCQENSKNSTAFLNIVRKHISDFYNANKEELKHD